LIAITCSLKQCDFFALFKPHHGFLDVLLAAKLLAKTLELALRNYDIHVGDMHLEGVLYLTRNFDLDGVTGNLKHIHTRLGQVDGFFRNLRS
jgi:hypothetical protein